MKKFEFRLNSLLNVRKIEEEKKLNEFARLVNKHNDLKAKVHDIDKEFHSNSEYPTMSRYHDQKFLLIENYLHQLYRQKSLLQKQLKKLQPDLNHARDSFLQARKKREVLNIIRNRHFQDYCDRYRKLDNKKNMEINSMRAQKHY